MWHLIIKIDSPNDPEISRGNIELARIILDGHSVKLRINREENTLTYTFSTREDALIAKKHLEQADILTRPYTATVTKRFS